MNIKGWITRLTRRDKTLCCQEVADLSSDYMEEGLPPTISGQFRAHMDSCPECGSFYATFRATVLTLRGLPKRNAPAGLKQRIQSQIAAEPSAGQPGTP